MRSLRKTLADWFDGENSATEKIQPSETALAEHDALAAMPSFFEDEALSKRQKLLQWQDRWIAELPQLWFDVERQLDEKISEAIEKMGPLEQIRKEAFFKGKLRPLIDEYVGKAKKRISDDIQLDLNRLELGTNVSTQGYKGTDDTPQYEGIGVIGAGTAAVPIIAGAAAVPLAVNASITTSAGIFGLFATTTIAWPVVAGGAVVAAVLGATGLIRTGKLFSSSKKAFADGVKNFLFELLIYNQEESAMAQQMQRQIFFVSQSMLNELPVATDLQRAK